MAALLYPLGTLIQIMAPDFPILCAGRLLYGAGIGIAMHAAPLYIAETSPSRVRGLLVSLKEVAIVAGILLGYVFSEIAGEDWRRILGTPMILEGLLGLLVVSPWVPESPRWLAAQAAKFKKGGSMEKARELDGMAEEAAGKLKSDEALRTVRMYYDMEAQKRIEKEEEDDEKNESFLRILRSDQAARRALLIGFGLTALQQISGQPSVLYYATTLFKQAGLGGSALVILGSWKLACTFVGASLVDRFGRRPLLTTGTFLMAASLATLSVLFASSSDGSASPTAALIATLIYVGGYQVGFGPVNWLLLSEIMPMSIRTTGVAICVIGNFGFNFGVTTAFEAARESIGTGGLFGAFFLVTVGALVFIRRLVPETRGLSLEEINDMLKE